VVTPGVVVIDELREAGFQLTGQIVVLEQYPVHLAEISSI
jgi:hypothetical protein